VPGDARSTDPSRARQSSWVADPTVVGSGAVRRTTAALWAEQDRHPGDRHRLYRAVADAVDADTVLYPGSWCDIAASFVWPSVTYVDAGDVAMASIDPRYELAGVIHSRDGRYRCTSDDLHTYLVPKTSVEDIVELVGRTGRGLAYTRSAYAYLFRRVR
jgi:hypothetical protein